MDLATPIGSAWTTDPSRRNFYVVKYNPRSMANNPAPATPTKQDLKEIVSWKTPDKGSFPQLRYYSGLAAVANGSGQLSLFHRLEENGTFPNYLMEAKDLRNAEGGRKPLATLMKPGLAAVCLSIPGLPRGLPDTLSGFRLRRKGVDFVVTCARFTAWPKNQEDFAQMTWRYSCMENVVALATQTGEVTDKEEDDTDKLKLQLIALHLPWDLAIFQVIEKPEGDEENTVIDWAHIQFLALGDRDKLRSKDLWWSVGYNLDNNQQTFHSDWVKFFLRQPINIQADIREQYCVDETKLPDVQVLKTNQRTVSFGTLGEVDQTGTCQQPYHLSLNLSAWYGRTGSMVCAREKSGVDWKESQVHVHGVILGGDPSTGYNTMVLFTEEMRDWFEKAMDFHPDEKEQSVDFHQRFVGLPRRSCCW